MVNEGGFLISWFHDYVLGFLVFILVMVGGVMLGLMKEKWI